MYPAENYILCATFHSQNVSHVYLQALLRNGPLRRSGSFKVTYFGTSRKLLYDFLLVINTNLPPPILRRFQLMADYWSNFR